MAYVPYGIGPWGDIVPQTLCPNMYVCDFSNEESILGVPVSTQASILEETIKYEAVAGNVLFDWRHLPDPPASYGLSKDAIRDTWKKRDNYTYEVNSHICSYSCFLSTAVLSNPTDLSRCFVKKDPYKSALPLNVQQFGLC